LALSVPLSRFMPQAGGGSAFFVRPHEDRTLYFWLSGSVVSDVAGSSESAGRYCRPTDAGDFTFVLDFRIWSVHLVWHRFYFASFGIVCFEFCRQTFFEISW